jgi:hypothetical protein
MNLKGGSLDLGGQRLAPWVQRTNGRVRTFVRVRVSEGWGTLRSPGVSGQDVAAFDEGKQGGADAQAVGLGGAVAWKSLLEDPQRLAWREEEEGGGVGSGGAADAVSGVIGTQAHLVRFLGALGAQNKKEGGEEAAVVDRDAFGEGEAPEAATQGLDHGVAVLASGQEGVLADYDTEVNSNRYQPTGWRSRRLRGGERDGGKPHPGWERGGKETLGRACS